MPFGVGNEYGFGQKLLNKHLEWLLPHKPLVLFSQISVSDFSFGLLWLLAEFLSLGAEALLAQMRKSFPALQFLILELLSPGPEHFTCTRTFVLLPRGR